MTVPRSPWTPAAIGLLVLAAMLPGWPVSAQTDDVPEAEAETVAPDSVEPGSAVSEDLIVEEIDALHFVTWVSANLREQPDGSSAILANLPFGSQIFVTGRLQNSDWVRVQTLNGETGFMWAEVLAPMIVALPGAPGGPPQAGGGPQASADNTPAMAQDLGILSESPTSAQGMVGPSDETDFYRFEVADWAEISVELIDLVTDADLSLLDTNGELLADSVAAGNAPEQITYLAAPGTYFIEVYIFEGETPYTLTARAQPAGPPPDDTAGDTPGTALDLGDATGQTVSADEWIGQADQVDFLSFTVSERSTLEITMSGMHADADISLEDDFGSVLTSSVEGGPVDEHMTTDVEAGTYYLRVVPYAGNTPYSISVSASPAGPPPEDSAGNDAASARDIGEVTTESGVYEDWVGPADGADFYRFTISAPSQLRLVMDGLASDADVEIIDEATGGVIASSALAGSESELIELPLNPGTYLVRVYVFSGSTDYRLELSADPSQ